MPDASSIKLAVDLSRGLFVQARGRPAVIVSYGAAAAVVFLSVTLTVGGYSGGKALYGGLKEFFDKRKALRALRAARSD